MTKILTRKANIRLSGYDYTQSNYYYITVCTENKREWFGEIKNHEMVLNPYGRICWERLQNLPDYYKNIAIDTFVIMPNHIHAILNIVGAGFPRPNNTVHDKNSIGRGNRAPTIRHMAAYFKYQTTKQINESQNTPGVKIWQRNFYDHIIRNGKSLNKIREYIRNNPATWNNDIENPDRIDNIETELIKV